FLCFRFVLRCLARSDLLEVLRITHGRARLGLLPVCLMFGLSALSVLDHSLVPPHCTSEGLCRRSRHRDCPRLLRSERTSAPAPLVEVVDAGNGALALLQGLVRLFHEIGVRVVTIQRL